MSPAVLEGSRRRARTQPFLAERPGRIEQREVNGLDFGRGQPLVYPSLRNGNTDLLGVEDHRGQVRDIVRGHPYGRMSRYSLTSQSVTVPMKRSHSSRL